MYTLMTLLGDFGGFNGSMVMIPTFLMSYISSIMYKLAITVDMPIKKKGRSQNAASYSSLVSKVLSNNDQASLSTKDVATLTREA